MTKDVDLIDEPEETTKTKSGKISFHGYRHLDKWGGVSEMSPEAIEKIRKGRTLIAKKYKRMSDIQKGLSGRM